MSTDPVITVGTVTPEPVTPEPVTTDEEDAPDPIKLSSDTAGDAVQVTINTTAATPLSSATDIVVDLKKFGVPSSIAENSININSSGPSPAYVGEPNSVTVNGTKVSLALYARFPGADSSAGDVRGDYTITIKQSAGITNPIVAGTRPP